MIPIGGILLAAGIAARAAARAANNGNTGGGAPRPPAPKPITRGSAGTGIDGLAVVVWVCCAGPALALPFALASGDAVAITFCTMSWVFTFPWLTARRVFAPLGLPRFAYYTANFSRYTWLHDKPGGPALAAALALVHDDKPSLKSIAWIEKKLTESKSALHPSGVAALALLEAAKGQYDTARAMFESLLQFDKRLLPKAVKKVAACWLASDAAARGDWEKVIQIATTNTLPYSRMVALLAACARRALGKPDAPGNVTLWFSWLWAPRRIWTFMFVRSIAGRKVKPAAAVGAPVLAPLPNEAGPVAAVLHRHLSVRLRGGKIEAAELKQLAHDWETVLASDKTLLQVADRCAALSGGDVDVTLGKVRELLESELAKLSERAKGTTGGEAPSLLRGGMSQRRDELFERLERLMASMDRRKQEKRGLDMPSEWRECVMVRSLYAELVQDVDLNERHAVFSVVRDRFVNYAVWMYNDRAERGVANAVFRFLWTEAVSVGDEASAKLNQKNAECPL